MNEPQSPDTSDDRVLDQLVDDELPEVERRRLLTRLDGQPDGWRRCAMAFLQAQAWRRAMRGLGQSAAARPSISAAGPVATLDGKKKTGAFSAPAARAVLPWFATAAGVLFAFGLGMLSQQAFDRAVSGRDSPVAQAAAERGHGSAGAADQAVAQAQRPAVPPEDNAVRDADARFGPQVAPTWPAQVVEAFRRQGHQIRWKQGFVPFSFEDGRQGIVPVEDVYVVPTRLTTY